MPKLSDRVIEHINKQSISIDHLLNTDYSLKELHDICTYKIPPKSYMVKKLKMRDETPTYAEYLAKAGHKLKDYKYR